MSHWYVVQTQPHAERKAIFHLARQGFHTYLPLYRKRRRHARKVEIVSAPLFPRYLFVAIDLASQQWRSIQSTLGVSRLVCNGERPAELADAVILEMKQREDNAGFVQLERRINFSPGEKVRVLEGIFSSYLGVFEGMSGSERVSVLLDLLGRKVRVNIEAEAVGAF